MDNYEATRIVFSRIQNIDPENASKIMGLLLIQDHGEKEMIRLAFGPEALLHSVVLKARKDLSLSSTTTPSSPFFSNPISISRQNMLIPSPTCSSSWAPNTFSDLHNPDDLISPNSTTSASYAAVVGINGFNTSTTTTTTATTTTTNNNNMFVGCSSSSPTSSPSPYYDLIDDFQLQDQLSFLNDGVSPTIGPKTADLFYPPPESATSPCPSPSSNTEGMLFPPYTPNWGVNNGFHHRRSSSVTDICLGSDPLGSGFGWKPCLYFARGYCKNGTSCRFLHGLPDSSDATTIVGSPSKLDVMEQCHELLRSKTQQQQQQQQQQRLSAASQLMASASFPYSAAATGKCMNFLLQQQQQQQQNDTQRATAAALMLGEDIHKFGRTRMERSDFLNPGGGMVNPGSRQIYLTFPADSTFREEDVSNYFSIYGPVQDVRIPYQQKRMFGFVTFVYPETVKLILAKGNPHFVCDARVLVKPYKEKGKVPDKKQQQQQVERGEFSACTTPTGLDSRDPYDLQLGGARMFNTTTTTQDMLLRRKLEEHADLQQAIDLQSRRLMSLQLLDLKKHHRNLNLSAGAAASIPSPTHVHSPHFNHTLILPSSSSDRSSSPEGPQENCASPATAAADQHLQQHVAAGKEEFNRDDNGNGKVENPNHDDYCDFHDSNVDHILPDSPFASPTKYGGDPPSFFSNTVTDAERNATIAVSSSSSSSSSSSCSSNNNNNNHLIASSILPATSTLDMASLKSCFFQIPRLSSGHGAIGM